MYFDRAEALNAPSNPTLAKISQAIGIKSADFTPVHSVMIAYFMASISASLHVTVSSLITGNHPTNFYGTVLAPSGFGKTSTVNKLNALLKAFRTAYNYKVFNEVSAESIQDHASAISALTGKPAEEVLASLQADFNQAGKPLFSFGSATSPAIKQLHSKYALGRIGALNFIIDEIGSNLMGNKEALDVFLELFDQGLVEQKLLKNTQENTRAAGTLGRAPANMLMFGVPNKLFDGSSTEEAYLAFLEAGYARRCFFGAAAYSATPENLDIDAMYAELLHSNSISNMEEVSEFIASFAKIEHANAEVVFSEQADKALLAYQQQCRIDAEKLGEFKAVQAAELAHRYFKVAKLAGVFAFFDNSDEVNTEHLLAAIKIAEESGQAFTTIINRELPHVRLARYLANSTDVTYAEMVHDLSFFPNSQVKRTEMMNLARAWGIRNNHIITKNTLGGVDFFSSTSFEETDRNKLRLSYSDDVAIGYTSVETSFEGFCKFLTNEGYNWCNHSFNGGHRADANAKPAFNLLVFDIDESASLEEVHNLFHQYEYVTYTTKRHTDDANRFRLVIPASHLLHGMDKTAYANLISNIAKTFPFTVDDASMQRSKKWANGPSTSVITHNKGKLFNVLPHISGSLIETTQHKEIKHPDKLAAWFAANLNEGSRNNTLFRYGAALLSQGNTLETAIKKVRDLNNKSDNPISEEELHSTIFNSLSRKDVYAQI